MTPKTIFYSCCIFFLSSCAELFELPISHPTTEPSAALQDQTKSTSSSIKTSDATPSTKEATHAVSVYPLSSVDHLTIDQIITTEEPNAQTLYDDSRYDFPITINSKVEGWIDYFTHKGKGHMERYLTRSGRYTEIMKKILKKSNLPEDLVYLALIESGFNLRANSRVRAKGPWQFIKSTAQRYGLRVDAWVDERFDPIQSTIAASHYMKDLYLMFESWYLAAAAYNAGEYKLLRGIEKAKTNNFWAIAKSRLIRRETKDYIPKIIAASLIGKNPKKYGFTDLDYLKPLEYETVTVDFPIKLCDIAKILDIKTEDILELNPQYRQEQIPPDGKTYEIRIPPGSKTILSRALSIWREKLQITTRPVEHTIRRGESLLSIAKKYHTSKRILSSLNNLSKREKLLPGTKLIVPLKKDMYLGTTNDRNKKKSKPSSSASVPKALRTNKEDDTNFIIHTVQKGESLWSISEKYDVTVQALFKWNGLRRAKRLMPGTKLRVQKPSPDVPIKKS